MTRGRAWRTVAVLQAVVASAGWCAVRAEEVSTAPTPTAYSAAEPVITVSKAGDGIGAPIALHAAVRTDERMAFASSAAQQVDGRPLASSSLTSRFGMRGHPVSGGFRMHSGVDLAAPAGSPVYATASGVVSFANWNGSYGQLVVVDHGNQIQTRFAHLSRLLVAPGQRVSKGQVVGLVGSTGRSTGPHLHYEIRQAGRAVNPLTR